MTCQGNIHLEHFSGSTCSDNATSQKVFCNLYFTHFLVFVPQIFVESLLCSGRLANIQLAGEMIHTSSHQGQHHTSTVSPEGTTVQRVPYDEAVQLVLMASEEYFDSSANLTDSSMDLARLVVGDSINYFEKYFHKISIVQ